MQRPLAASRNRDTTTNRTITTTSPNPETPNPNPETPDPRPETRDPTNMRIARVIGTVTLNRRLAELKPGRLLVAQALDEQALAGHADHAPRASAMPESLVVFDELGAGAGQLIAVSEGREASMPFHPDDVPVDAYAAAILDCLEI